MNPGGSRAIYRAALQFVEEQPNGGVWLHGAWGEEGGVWKELQPAEWDGSDAMLLAKAEELGWKRPERSNPYDPTGKTPEEIAELVHDKMQGGPRMRMAEYAYEMGSTYHEVLERTKAFVEDNEYWSEGSRFEGASVYPGFWNDYELITGEVVPADKKHNFFSCSC